MEKNHLFILDPLASLNRQLDSSLRIMFELSRRGHRVYGCEPAHLEAGTAHGAGAHAYQIRFEGGPTALTAAPAGRLPFGYFSAIHMRKDPPYDIDYVATTWLLDRAPAQTRIYNRPEALRRYNEKLLILDYPEDSAPALVSASSEALEAFVMSTARGDAILKPLTLFGGRGVIRLQCDGSAAALAQLRATLAAETGDGRTHRLIQTFDRGIASGEVRVFTAFGQPLAWCLKRPAADTFLANTRAGATLHPFVPDEAVSERVIRVAKDLQTKGIVFIGFDLINGLLSEVNITSPRMLIPPGDDVNYYNKIAMLIDQDLR